MRKNAEGYGVRELVKAEPSLYVNGEQSSTPFSPCHRTPFVLHGPPPEELLRTLFLS